MSTLDDISDEANRLGWRGTVDGSPVAWFACEVERLWNEVDALNAIHEAESEGVAKLQAIVGRLLEDMGTISDKLGSVIRTIPQGERSDCFIEAVDAANRIAFTAWRETAEKARGT